METFSARNWLTSCDVFCCLETRTWKLHREYFDRNSLGESFDELFRLLKGKRNKKLNEYRDWTPFNPSPSLACKSPWLRLTFLFLGLPGTSCKKTREALLAWNPNPALTFNTKSLDLWLWFSRGSNDFSPSTLNGLCLTFSRFCYSQRKKSDPQGWFMAKKGNPFPFSAESCFLWTPYSRAFSIKPVEAKAPLECFKHFGNEKFFRNWSRGAWWSF